MKKYFLLITIFFTFSSSANANELSFGDWVEKFKLEAISLGITETTLDQAFVNVNQPLEKVLKLDRKQPEHRLTYRQYKKNVITQRRIDIGRAKFSENRVLLKNISEEIGVEEKFILALWGSETDFGKITGNFSIIHALATLAYDGRRSEFFKNELIDSLKILDGNHIKADELIGSWAGAMGQTQFMPSSYLKFAYDYNKDGKADIWHSKEDVFSSIANYLASSGWKKNEGWGMKVRLPENFDLTLAGLDREKTISEWRALGIKDKTGNELPESMMMASLINLEEDKVAHKPGGEYYLAFPNYKILMKWNRSVYFATSVGLLADLIDKKVAPVTKVKNETY